MDLQGALLLGLARGKGRVQELERGVVKGATKNAVGQATDLNPS